MTTRAPLDNFETELLTALRAEVATRDTQTSRPSRARRRVAALAVAVVGAVMAVLAAFLLQPTAAYAVEKETNGDVVVTIKSLKDADGLERALRDAGINAEVDYDATPIMLGGDEAGALLSESMNAAEAEASTHSESAEGSGTAGESSGGTAELEGDAEAYAGADDGSVPPIPADAEVFAIESHADGSVTFRLPASLVGSEETLYITTSGDAGMGGIAISSGNTSSGQGWAEPVD
ncbi:MAG: hypothetical protein HZY75_12655 [Nocardioidaceae bacterium]|nr:MAG: hypothetical protein HZY75_12655 [Nocardioidaceae bacterium]